MKKIIILGSTGSIGKQTLDIVSQQDDLCVSGLSVNKNIDLLFEQIIKFNPKVVCVVDYDKGNTLKNRLKENNIKTEVLLGEDGLVELSKYDDYDVLLNSVVGIAGLMPTIAAIKNKKDIALANKETLVTAGQLIIDLVKEHKVSLLPVDSEHSAIFQCLQGNKEKQVDKIILTASGGAFRDKTKEELKKVTVKDALNHPNWSMGQKITIDSATLMNKGLEVIEAKWLFDKDAKDIDVVVHRQSIVHSMVQFQDNSVIAQLGTSDMRLPIQYALNYPNRYKNNSEPLNFFGLNLTFEEPKYDLFPCLTYAYDTLKIGGNMGVVYNSANEACVELFLQEKINYLDIQTLIYEAMNAFVGKVDKSYSIESIIFADKFARDFVHKNYKK